MLYVCMYLCMYVCIYLSIDLCIHVCMYVCIYACMHVCLHMENTRRIATHRGAKITKGFRSPNGVGLKSPRLKEAKSNQEITKKITKGFRARL